MRYNKSVIAFLNTRDEIAELPAEVRVEADFDQMQAFVSEQIAALRAGLIGGS